MDEAAIVAAIKSVIGNPSGKCYPASEAAYHLLGGKEAGYTPMRNKYHWWLRRADGSYLDITIAQFENHDPPIYPWLNGKGGGFLTKKPSKRAQEIINAIQI